MCASSIFYLIGYFVLVVGAALALWQAGVLARISGHLARPFRHHRLRPGDSPAVSSEALHHDRPRMMLPSVDSAWPAAGPETC